MTAAPLAEDLEGFSVNAALNGDGLGILKIDEQANEIVDIQDRAF